MPSNWNRDDDFEARDAVIRAYHNPETDGVYYVTEPTEDFSGYTLCYWPAKRKSIETVSLIESFDTESEALDELDKKTT